VGGEKRTAKSEGGGGWKEKPGNFVDGEKHVSQQQKEIDERVGTDLHALTPAPHSKGKRVRSIRGKNLRVPIRKRKKFEKRCSPPAEEGHPTVSERGRGKLWRLPRGKKENGPRPGRMKN